MLASQVNSGRHLFFQGPAGMTITALLVSKNAQLPFVPADHTQVQQVAPGVYLLPMGLDDVVGPLIVNVTGTFQPPGAPPGVVVTAQQTSVIAITAHDFFNQA